MSELHNTTTIQGIHPQLLRGFSSLLLVAVAILSGCAGSPAMLARKHMERGSASLAKNDLPRAILEFKIASQNTPDDPEPLYQLGLAYLRAKNGRGAVGAFEKVLRLRQNHPGALYQYARLKAGANQPVVLNDAANMLQTLLSEHASDAPGLYTLALVEIKLGKPDDALRHFEAALSLKTDNVEDIHAVIAAASRRDHETAKKMVSLATAKLPASAEIAVMAGESAMLAGEHQTGAAEIARALSIDPRLREALAFQIHLASAAGRNDEAEALSRRLAALPDPDTRTAYAEILMAHGKRDQAVAEYQALRDRFPDDHDLQNRYIAALSRMDMSSRQKDELDRGIAKDPRRGDLLLARARLNLDQGRTGEAEKDLRALSDLKFWNGNVALEWSRYHHARGEKMEEGSLLSEAIKLNPRLLSARLRMSALLNELGKADAALAILDGATDSDRRNPEYKLYRNAALMSTGNWAEAAKNIAEVLKQGRTPAALIQDAALSIHNKDLSGAQKTLEEALKLSPGDPGALMQMASVYRTRNQPREYLAWIERHAEANPAISSLQIYAARILRSAGNFAGARRDLNRAASEGAEGQANVELAALDIVEGKVDQARTRLDASVKKNDTAQERALLADIFVRNKDWLHAEEQLRADLALAPGDSVAMINLAGVISKNPKRTPEAMQFAEKALALSPGNPGVENAGGWLYYLTGSYQQAIPHLEAALKSSGNASTRYRLAAACIRAGDHSCATKQYELALKEDPNAPERSEVESLRQSR